ncbi:hypothetical protein [Rhodoferax sp.]|uniref:hypothetical protein n=1 Tax=Rhodoferax sp. TaxID=50421 RepID=UPI0025D8CE90|nr:hypothetical protein [Rhodoferax sp.]
MPASRAAAQHIVAETPPMSQSEAHLRRLALPRLAQAQAKGNSEPIPISAPA